MFWYWFKVNDQLVCDWWLHQSVYMLKTLFWLQRYSDFSSSACSPQPFISVSFFLSDYLDGYPQYPLWFLCRFTYTNTKDSVTHHDFSVLNFLKLMQRPSEEVSFNRNIMGTCPSYRFVCFTFVGLIEVFFWEWHLSSAKLCESVRLREVPVLWDVYLKRFYHTTQKKSMNFTTVDSRLFEASRGIRI